MPSKMWKNIHQQGQVSYEQIETNLSRIPWTMSSNVEDRFHSAFCYRFVKLKKKKADFDLMLVALFTLSIVHLTYLPFLLFYLTFEETMSILSSKDSISLNTCEIIFIRHRVSWKWTVTFVTPCINSYWTFQFTCGQIGGGEIPSHRLASGIVSIADPTQIRGDIRINFSITADILERKKYIEFDSVNRGKQNLFGIIP